MKKIRFGMVGCGVVSRVHAESIALLEGAELRGVFDPNAAAAEQFASKYSAKVYSAYEQMLEDGEIDAVSICTPSGLHAEQTLLALRAGKNVVLEKPMALNSRDAERILAAEKEQGKLVSVIAQTRYSGDVAYLKQVIDEGKLGKLVFCDLYMKYWRDASYYNTSSWKGTLKMDGGGALMNQGIHGVDLMVYLLGLPRVVGSVSKTMVHSIEAEDTLAAVLEYPSGAIGVIEASTSANPGFEREVVINGSRGYAKIVDSKLEKLVIDAETVVDTVIQANPGTSSNPAELGCGMHLLQYRNFLDAVNGKAKLIADSSGGYMAVKLVEDIYKTAKNVK